MHPQRHEEITKLREATELTLQGGPAPVASRTLGLILDACNGDVDLAATAITMAPRPPWVCELLGPTKGMVSKGAA